MIKDYIQAARLRTLPLSVSGIILGAFVARWRLLEQSKTWDWKILALALLVTLCYQVLSNFANDYGDGIKGTDKNRIQEAESRAVASGRISEKQMKNAVMILSVVSFLTTISLLSVAFFPDFMNAFWTFMGLGILCILAAIGYTMGKKPYGYMGLGDLMVFIFFGLVSVEGSYFLFTKQFDGDVLLLASAIGLLSTAVLNLNNMRDMDNDALSGKKTLALKLGLKNAKIYQMVLLQLPILLVLIFLLINHFFDQQKYYAFMVMILYFPLMKLRRSIMEISEPQKFDPFLKQVGIIALMTAILIAVGLNAF